VIILKAIIKEKVRILRPHEAKMIIEQGIPKFQHQLLFKSLLYTGARYIEVQRLKENPEWFDGDFIKLPSLKKKARQKERWIRLNPRGKEIISSYVNSEYSLPTKVTWRENLRRWASSCNLSPEGLCAKTTRKTWESWLTFYYGTRAEIPQSQGHTDAVAFQHYLNLPFTESDKSEIKEFVDGWI
jgi:integrase